MVQVPIQYLKIKLSNQSKQWLIRHGIVWLGFIDNTDSVIDKGATYKVALAITTYLQQARYLLPKWTEAC